jgi:hypothetical protein
VYQNLAARSTAVQWQRLQQAAQAAQQGPEPGGTVSQKPQEVAQAAAHGPIELQQVGNQQQQQGQQQGEQQSQADAQPEKQQEVHLSRKRRRTVQLQEAELDWDAAAPLKEAEQGEAAANAAEQPGEADALQRAAGAGHTPDHSTRQQQDGRLSAAGGSARSTTSAEQRVSAQTQLGSLEFKPLAPTLTASRAGSDGQQGGADNHQAHGADVQLAPPSAPTSSSEQAGAVLKAEQVPAAKTAAATAVASATDEQAATGSVAAQVDLFVRAELHPLQKRGQLTAQEHDAGGPG